MPRRFFHYQKFVEEHLGSLLSAQRVKLSRPDAFNDPWDCRMHVREPHTPEETTRILGWMTEMHRKHFPMVPEARRALLVYGYKANPEELKKALRKLEEQMYREICQRYRVYCLSEKPDSALMWGHYAGGHTGICLELDGSVAPFRAATKVEYRERYPSFDLVTVGYEPLVTKSDHWSYEAEWRLIAEERAHAQAAETFKTDDGFLTFGREVLKSITVGCLAPPATRDRVAALVQEHSPEVIVRQAEIARDRYEVMIRPSFSEDPSATR